MSKTIIHETDDYTVSVEHLSMESVPAERRRVYFIRHKVYDVVEMTTPMLAEALCNVHALQKVLDIAIADPETAGDALPQNGGGLN